MKRAFLIISTLALSLSVYAQESKVQFKPYGFIRNYFAYDSRESSAGTEDLFFYMPKDENIKNGIDINAVPSFRFAALTSRIGMDVSGYEIDGYKVSAKIEADFYAGLSGNTGTAQLRLRQAYLGLTKDSRTWKIGQAWHPMAADFPDIFSLEVAAPFGPFNRSPLVSLDLGLGSGFSLSAAAIWQMQYNSSGPEGASANYIKYGCIPELYLGLNLKGSAGVLKIGADYLNIKPYRIGSAGDFTDSRKAALTLFQYGQVKLGSWTIKEKVTYSEDASHLNMIGGYGVSNFDSKGNPSYSSNHALSGWLSIMHKSKNSRWAPSILFGAAKNLGASEALLDGYCWFKNSASTLNTLYRIQPEIVYNLGKIQFGLEYMLTCAQYGDAGSYLKPNANLHNVINHRIQSMIKYTF